MGAPQARRRHLTATPHVALQADHPDHAVQPPWTVQFDTLIDIPEIYSTLTRKLQGLL